MRCLSSCFLLVVYHHHTIITNRLWYRTRNEAQQRDNCGSLMERHKDLQVQQVGVQQKRELRWISEVKRGNVCKNTWLNKNGQVANEEREVRQQMEGDQVLRPDFDDEVRSVAWVKPKQMVRTGMILFCTTFALLWGNHR